MKSTIVRKNGITMYQIEKTIKSHLIEWSATALSVIGAVFNANQLISGFYIWSVANVLWMVFAIKFKHWGLLVMNLIFLCINIFGIFTWWRNPFVIFG